MKKNVTAIAALLLTWIITPIHGQDSNNAKGASPQNPVVEKAFISFRIGTGQWMPENRYRELLAMFEKHKGVTDEITLFTSITCSPLPLEVIKQRCNILAQRMSQARALGYRVGVNVLATLGHLAENLPNSLSGDYTCMTDVTGQIGPGVYCPNDPRVQSYVRELYRLVTEANPDYIWIDDDVRIGFHPPVMTPCFCDNCLAIFEKESGARYTRESLRKALSGGPMENRTTVRQAWLAHNEAAIDRILAIIEHTVHGVKPGLPLGLMAAERFYDGNGFARYARTLAGPGAAPVYWRPGGAVYTDFVPGDMFRKSHQLGRQISLLPLSVVSIESEIENFPYQRLMKSCQMTALEAASHIGAGCTGTAFNVLPENSEPIAEHEPMFDRLRQVRPFLDQMVKAFGRTQPVGVFSAWKKDAAVVADFHGGDWFGMAEGPLGSDSSQVFELGIPAAYSPEGATATLLNRQSVVMFSKEELTRILSSGVYMDGETLAMLNKMGFQDLTGMTVDRVLPNDCIEEIATSPLNGPLAGRRRDARQAFWHGAGYSLKLVDPKAETLARLVDYADHETAATSMAVFENRLGGRICVCGYYPWTFLYAPSKMTQMKSIMQWLSRDRLPAYVGSYHKVNLWARRPTEDRLSVALINASFDPANQLILMLLTQSEKIKVVDMAGNGQSIQESGRSGPYRQFVLPQIEPWNARLVVAGE